MSRPFSKDYQYLRQASRSKFRRINSLDLIPEDPYRENQENPDLDPPPVNTKEQQQVQLQQQNKQRYANNNSNNKSFSLSKRVQQFVFFWPHLLFQLIIAVVRYILYIPLSIAAPSFWLSALLWIFWKCVRGPVVFVKWLISSDNLKVNAGAAPQSTVLLSSGSTIQTLHLARNFYSSGARVVVFEFDGLFGLSRFSTAVDKFYVVPRPTANNYESYIEAICHIVDKEKPQVYIPVCATSPAYYDALVKPHLELLGCATFIPGVQETRILDDCLMFYQKCAAQNIPLPPHTVLSSWDDLHHLYESGFISNTRNILMAVGMQGILKRYKYILPNRRQDLKFTHEINDRQQWLVVRDQPGYHHYVTCTSVRDSRVIANVTCKVDYHTKNLIPLVRRRRTDSVRDDETQIEFWLHSFFAKVRFQRSINGHISFRFIKNQSGQFVPLGVRLGVSLPYICYNRASHARVLSNTVKGIHRQHFGQADERESESAVESMRNSWSWSSNSQTPEVLDKCEALFAYWDPLPYCAYYHFQIPLESVKLFLQKRNRSKTLSPSIALSVR